MSDLVSRFPDLAIHEALQRALAARGYETATPVQAAVLNPALAARDLLVSSQTGSGKTIAFGAALVGTLTAERPAGAAPVVRVAGAPRALVIVPTRELAAQVREELGWLLAGTGLRLAAFTGGTAVSGDLRALHRGVDLAIGTPGRLVDLLRREKLALSALEVVVLDEADEMLDLGFREDLETLLGAAPVERRTLLLSATLPSEIRSLARRFQRDALAIDPRKDGPATGGGGQATPAAHDDITYVAHLIAGGDRLAAVVNLLRASDDARAIVFCTTRDAVGSLHRELMARGFAATAISGERAQAERDRALDQVRQGEARILVATNVAARGLHLPDVDLIIHADLPLNAESLTHRSGRTGRAGRKGTAVVIASLAERRKAERLLATAHVHVAWTAPPSAKQITAAARARLLENLLAESSADGDRAEAAVAPMDPDDDLLAPFRGKLSSDDLARRLLARELERLPVGETLAPVILPSAGGDRRFGPAGGDTQGRRRAPGEIGREGVMFRVNIGAKDQADPRWLLPLICRRGGVTRREVGAIRIGPQETLFEIAGDAAKDFAVAASVSDPRAPHVRMERADRPPAAEHRQAQAATPVPVPVPVAAAAPAAAAVPVAVPVAVGAAVAAAAPRPAAPRAFDRPPPRVETRPARPLPAKGPSAKAYPAKAHQAKAHQTKPPFGKPPFGKPPFGKPPFGKPPFAKPPHAKATYAKLYDGSSPPARAHAAKPHAAKPHAAKPHAAKPHGGKPDGGRDRPAHAPGAKRKG